MVITSRQPLLSSVLMQDSFNIVENFNYAPTLVGSAADSTLEVGSVVVWDTDHFRLIALADVATLLAASGSDLPNGVELGVVVGFSDLGDAFSKDLSAGVNEAGVVLFRGLASVKNTGLKFATDITLPADIAAIHVALEKQNIAVKKATAAVSVSHYGF